MKVKELIQRLNRFDPELDVLCSAERMGTNWERSCRSSVTTMAPAASACAARITSPSSAAGGAVGRRYRPELGGAAQGGRVDRKVPKECLK